MDVPAGQEIYVKKGDYVSMTFTGGFTLP